MKNRIDIISREEVNKLIETCFPENTAVISFYDPPRDWRGRRYEGPVDYRGICDRVFYVECYDLDPESLGEVGLTFDEYFPEATELAEFIRCAVEDGMNIICQCEYGQSRSAACAAAIREYYDHSGIEIFADYRYYPNQMIFNKLYAAMKAEK